MSAGKTSCATKISPQRKQWLPSVRPVWVQVGTNAWSTTTLCPAGIISWATKISPQREQCIPAVKPVWVQDTSFASSITATWPKAGLSSTLFLPQSQV